MPTNENPKDNKPSLDTSSSTLDHASFVSGSLGGGVELSNTCPPSLSIVTSCAGPLVDHTKDKKTPPRPPRSPKRARLADITEEAALPESRRTERGLDDLRSVLEGFISRLEAIPPPDSPDSPDKTPGCTTATEFTISKTRKRTQSISTFFKMPDTDRSRTASEGTFGPGSEQGHGGQSFHDAKTGPNEAIVISQSATSTLPSTPILPTSGGQSPISPLALGKVQRDPRPQTGPSSRTEQVTVPTPPSLHITRPSTSSDSADPHAFEAIVDMMMTNKGSPSAKAELKSPARQDAMTSPSVSAPREGKAQIPRKGMMGPNAILAKVKSSSSLSNIKKQISKPSLKFQSLSAAHSKSSSTNTTFLRPAPPPPPSSTYPARFAPTEYSRSNASSPSPSTQRGGFAMASPGPRSSPARTLNPLHGAEGGEMVEIPRFGRKELNLALVRKRGPGQRIAWTLLWIVWLVNGLAGLFFDFNLMYMLVQCTTHSTNDDGPSRSWAFATAAYAICWAISIFVVWLGWEVYFEFWRKWRQSRPAIEPIYTSLPASLHLSLISYSHFTFLLHVRMSSLSTPFRYDILPETAYALVQMLPGILPLLPRAGIAIVLLTTFTSAADRRGDKDDRFFTPTDGLSSYAQGVALAFVAIVGYRLLVFLISAIILFLSSARPSQALFAPKVSRETPTTPQKPKRKGHMSTPPRDPATTRSPQKTWYEAETSIGWNTWRTRMRARVQDAYELCMIRRTGTGIGTMVDGSYVVLGGGATPSPSFNTAVRLGSRSVQNGNQGSVEELVEHEDPEKAKALTEGAVDEWLGTPKSGSTLMRLEQKGPDNPVPPSSHSYSIPSSQGQGTSTQRPNAAMRTTSNLSVSGYYTAGSQASHSSHDVFYTPASGNTPTVERTMPVLGMESRSTLAAPPGAYRNMHDPSNGTLAARPESDVMGNQELLQDQHRISQISTASDESVTDDSAALLSSSSRRESEATSGTESATPSRSNSTASPSQPSSRRSSASKTAGQGIARSRASSVAGGSHVLTRARSSSITLLRESAGAVQGVVRRARSGTVDGNAYNRLEGDSTPTTLPRRRSKLGLGASVVTDEQRAVSG